jgi:hypothetical protein
MHIGTINSSDTPVRVYYYVTLQPLPSGRRLHKLQHRQ